MTAITFIRALQVVCDLAQQAVTENEDDEQREILAEQNAALERIETAAPAMLAALQLAVSDADSTGCEGCAVISAHTVEAMESAITAATGGTPTADAERLAMIERLRADARALDDGMSPGQVRELHAEADRLESMGTPTAEPAAPIGEAVRGLLFDVRDFLQGFEDCEDNGELVQALQARIARATEGEG